MTSYRNLKTLPKAHLHIHLEGAMRPTTLTQLCKKYKNILPSDIEKSLPEPNFSINTLNHLKKDTNTNNYSLIIGDDNIIKLTTWKQGIFLGVILSHVFLRFSWRVMLVEKIGYTTFKIKSKNNESYFYVNNEELGNEQTTLK